MEKSMVMPSSKTSCCHCTHVTGQIACNTTNKSCFKMEKLKCNGISISNTSINNE
jgi:hypothetical protein